MQGWGCVVWRYVHARLLLAAVRGGGSWYGDLMTFARPHVFAAAAGKVQPHPWCRAACSGNVLQRLPVCILCVPRTELTLASLRYAGGGGGGRGHVRRLWLVAIVRIQPFVHPFTHISSHCLSCARDSAHGPRWW
jgi:hypothetical protein